MSMGMEIGIFLAYAMGMLLVYFAGRFLLVPMKWLGRILLNSIVGGIVILLINLLGGELGVFLPLNLMTAVIVGILGVPGIIMLIILFL